MPKGVYIRTEKNRKALRVSAYNRKIHKKNKDYQRLGGRKNGNNK